MLIFALLTTLLSTSKAEVLRYENFVEVKWAKVKDASQYRYEVVDSKMNTVMTKRTRKARAIIGLNAGRYRFRVRSLDVSGREGPWSDFHLVVIRPGPPIPFPAGKDLSGAEPGRKKLSWRTVHGENEYYLKVWRDDRVILLRKVTGDHMELDLQIPGVYRYALASRNEGLDGEFGPDEEFVLKEKVEYTVTFERRRVVEIELREGMRHTSTRSDISQKEITRPSLSHGFGMEVDFSTDWTSRVEFSYSSLSYGSGNANLVGGGIGVTRRLVWRTGKSIWSFSPFLDYKLESFSGLSDGSLLSHFLHGPLMSFHTRLENSSKWFEDLEVSFSPAGLFINESPQTAGTGGNVFYSKFFFGLGYRLSDFWGLRSDFTLENFKTRYSSAGSLGSAFSSAVSNRLTFGLTLFVTL